MTTEVTKAEPAEVTAILDAVKQMEGMRRPITEIKVIKSEFVQQGAPRLLVHPDDFDAIKNSSVIGVKQNDQT